MIYARRGVVVGFGFDRIVLVSGFRFAQRCPSRSRSRTVKVPALDLDKCTYRDECERRCVLLFIVGIRNE